MSFMVFAIFIAFGSLYYTNNLVAKLGLREQKLIDLYAKGLSSVASTGNDGDLSFLFQEIIQANNSVPVILADSKKNPLSSKNVDIPPNLNGEQKNAYLKKIIQEMEETNRYIEIEYIPGYKNYIYYKNSSLLTQLRYYPLIQLIVIFVFIILGYVVLNNTKRSEQNRVWIGMAKETAHQLGTPLSSLMAWTEIFKQDPSFSHPQFVGELEKDVLRLETVTSRFSNIGSLPSLKPEDVQQALASIVDYVRQRVSNRTSFEIVNEIQEEVSVKLNKPLFDWAVENILKNGVDALGGIGKITISMVKVDKSRIAIDIHDSGKGIPKNKFKTVFFPGYTTKARGWGLGLALSKRILEEYHGGKVFVKSSEAGKGTVFRIILKVIK